MSTAATTDPTIAAPLVGHLIDGQRVVDSGRSQSVYNPATGQVVRRVALAEQATVENAISAAETAFAEWRDTTPLARARVMFRFKELIEKHAETIVALITEEHGKVLDDARGEGATRPACGASSSLGCTSVSLKVCAPAVRALKTSAAASSIHRLKLRKRNMIELLKVGSRGAMTDRTRCCALRSTATG